MHCLENFPWHSFSLMSVLQFIWRRKFLLFFWCLSVFKVILFWCWTVCAIAPFAWKKPLVQFYKAAEEKTLLNNFLLSNSPPCRAKTNNSKLGNQSQILCIWHGVFDGNLILVSLFLLYLDITVLKQHYEIGPKAVNKHLSVFNFVQ